MKIYDRQQNLVLDVEVDDNSYRNRQIMGDNTLTLYFALAEHVEIPIGAYCTFENETYTLMRPEQLKMQHSRKFEYTVTFEGEQAKAKIWKFRNPVDGRLKFPLTAKPHEHLQMFVDNMNRRDSGWTVGDCISENEKLINYDFDYNIDALAKIAQEFKTEYEIIGKVVSLHKVEHDKNDPLPLSYGRGRGFKPGIGRANSGETPPVEILYVQGGDRNIDRSKYGSGELHLPKGQTIGYDGEFFEDEEGYNAENARHYMVDDLGYSIRNIDKQPTTLAEDSLDRTEDYPKRVGAISEVIEVNKEKNFYDFIDDSIEPTLNYSDYQIGEEPMTVIFQSGELAGREFDVIYHHEAKTINGVAKLGRRFEIVPQEIDGVMMPGETFVPQTQNTYAIFGCMLPESYISDNEHKKGAEWNMFRAAVKYLFDNEEQKFSFSGELDGIWAKKDWENIGSKIRLGGFVRFTSEQFQQEGVLVRIVGIKDNINDPHSPKIELSNETVSPGFISSIKTLEAQEVTIAENKREAIQYTKRRFRDAKETAEMLQEAFSDNFTNNINPVTVETMQMIVGDGRLQFRFIDDTATGNTVPHNVTWDADNKQLIAPGGIVQHMTLGIDTLSASHKQSEYRFYDINPFTSSILTDGSVKYYLYIRVPESSANDAVIGQFMLESSAHKFYEGNYYWLLYGVLNSEYDGARSFVTLYGYSEILPGRITTDRVVSSDGESYFDMLNNALKLGDKLIFNEDNDGQLKIRGTIVQSQSGEEAYIGCYRGLYNASYTYFEGDEVTYQPSEDSPLSTYRCIAKTPIINVPPTDLLSWQVIAAGSKGEDGSSIKIKGEAKDHYTTTDEWGATIPKIGTTYLFDTDGTDYLLIKKFGRVGMSYGWITFYAEPGDAYIIKNADNATIDGCLFVAEEEAWVNVGRIKGADGAKGDTGATGNYTEMRFAINGSITTAPKLIDTDLNPSGWSTTYPQVNKGFYLWMTKAVKTGDGATLVSPWTTPVRITPYDGTDGLDGKSPAMVFRGNYSPTATYYGNEDRRDCVKSGVTYYIARIDAGEIKGIAPQNTSKWNQFGTSFESVATNLLLSEEANIANLIFRNQRLESFASTNGVPNFFIDGMRNIASFAGGNAIFDQQTAKLGWLKIANQDLSGYDANGIERLRLTPNALPSVSTSSRSLAKVESVGSADGATVDTGQGDGLWAEKALTQTIDRDSGILIDNGTFSCYVDIIIPYAATTIFLSTEQHYCSGQTMNGESINITTTLTGSVSYKNGAYIGSVNFNQPNPQITIPNAGTIRLTLTLSCSYPSVDWQGTGVISFQDFPITSSANLSIIAKDGMMAIFNGNYMRMHSAEGFSVKVGNYYFRITASGGIQKSTDGSKWTQI